MSFPPARDAPEPPPPALAADRQKKPTKSKKKRPVAYPEEPLASEASPAPPSSPPRKRKGAPGVRVIGGRIYDPKNGKSCHQCRQKTMDFAVPCKNIRNDKPCPIHFCYKCLINRYGEKAEEVSTLDGWNCPKCRGICNCSLCMKKRGHQPTGILVHTAKATGFSSVLELLHRTGPKCLISEEIRDTTDATISFSESFVLSKKQKDLAIENSLAEDVSLDQEIEASLGGHVDNEDACAMKVNENDGFGEPTKDKQLTTNERRKIKKSKLKPLEKEEQINGMEKATSINVSEKSNKKKKKNNRRMSLQNDPGRKTEECGPDPCEEMALPTPIKSKEVVDRDDKEVGAGNGVSTMVNPIPLSLPQLSMIPTLSLNTPTQVVLPQGIGLTSIAGIELEAAEDVGPALQFLEFCAAFEKVLDIKNDEPETVLRELSSGRIGRRPSGSAIVEFHLKLISVVQKDAEVSLSSLKKSSNSWLYALRKIITESCCLPKEMPLDFFKEGTAGYDSLNLSQKLKILNFLCDEVLVTEDVRNWMDEENAKFAETKKEANEQFLAAKDKERELKQKLKNDVAQAMLALRNGAPLTIPEHDNLVSDIKTKTEKAHTEMLSSKEFLYKIKRIPDTVRIEPLLWNEKGQAFWRLKTYESCSRIVSQDIGSTDLVTVQDKWFFYDEEQEKVLEKHIVLVRNQRLKQHKQLKQTVEESLNL